MMKVTFGMYDPEGHLVEITVIAPGTQDAQRKLWSILTKDSHIDTTTVFIQDVKEYRG